MIDLAGVSSEPSTLKSSARRMVPKEKRRHYTAPHNNIMMKSLNSLPTEDSFNRAVSVCVGISDNICVEHCYVCVYLGD